MRRSVGSNPPQVRSLLRGRLDPARSPAIGTGGTCIRPEPCCGVDHQGPRRNPALVRSLPPTHSEARRAGGSGSWTGCRAGRRYPAIRRRWLRDEAQRRLDGLYPTAPLPQSMAVAASPLSLDMGTDRHAPNPVCGARMPLTALRSLDQEGREAWVQPIVDRAAKTVRFRRPERTEARGAAEGWTRRTFACLVCGQVAPEGHVKAEAAAGRMGVQLMAMVAEGARGRTYLEPSEAQEAAARSASPSLDSTRSPDNPRWFSPHFSA